MRSFTSCKRLRPVKALATLSLVTMAWCRNSKSDTFAYNSGPAGSPGQFLRRRHYAVLSSLNSFPCMRPSVASSAEVILRM